MINIIKPRKKIHAIINIIVSIKSLLEIVIYPNNNTISPLIPIVIELPMNEYLIIKENIHKAS